MTSLGRHSKVGHRLFTAAVVASVLQALTLALDARLYPHNGTWASFGLLGYELLLGAVQVVLLSLGSAAAVWITVGKGGAPGFARTAMALAAALLSVLLFIAVARGLLSIPVPPPPAGPVVPPPPP